MEFQRETLVPVRNPGLSNISGVASLDLIETPLHSKSPGVSHSETTELRMDKDRPWAAKNPGSLSNELRMDFRPWAAKNPGSLSNVLRMDLRPWAAKNPGSLSNVSREVRSTSGLAGLGTWRARKSSTSYTLAGLGTWKARKSSTSYTLDDEEFI